MSSLRLGLRVEVIKKRGFPAGRQVAGVRNVDSIEGIDWDKIYRAFKSVIEAQLNTAKVEGGIKAETLSSTGKSMDRFVGRRGRTLLPFTMEDSKPAGSYLSTLAYHMGLGGVSGDDFQITIGGIAPSGVNVSAYAALIDRALSNGQYTVKRGYTFRGIYGGRERYTTMKAGQLVRISQPVDSSVAFAAALAEFQRQMETKGSNIVAQLLFNQSGVHGTSRYSYKDKNAPFAVERTVFSHFE